MSSNLLKKIYTTLESYLHGKSFPIKLTILAFFSNGHVLIEDIPGIGKTVFALTFAKIMGLSFGRIQCTTDLLPSDINRLKYF